MVVSTQVLYPTALAAALINCTGDVQAVQAIDSLWVEPNSHTSDTEIRVAFATPKGVLVGEQVLRVQVTKSKPSTGHPTVILNLYQDGVFIHGVVSSPVATDTAGGSNLVYRFDASKFPDLTGANFVARIISTANVGKGQDQSAVRVGRFEWTVTADVPVVEKLGNVSISAAASSTVSGDLVIPVTYHFPVAVTNIENITESPSHVANLQDLWDEPDGLGVETVPQGDAWIARFDFDIPSPLVKPRFLYWRFVLTSSHGPSDPRLVGAAKTLAGQHVVKVFYDGVAQAQSTTGAGTYYLDLANVFDAGTVYDSSLIHIEVDTAFAIPDPFGAAQHIGVLLDVLVWTNELVEEIFVPTLAQASLQSISTLSAVGQVERTTNQVTTSAHLTGTSALVTEAYAQLLGSASFNATGGASAVGTLIRTKLALATLNAMSGTIVSGTAVKIADVHLSSTSSYSVDNMVTKITRAILRGTSEVTVKQTSDSLSKVAMSSASTLTVTGRSIKTSQVVLGSEATVTITGTVGSIVRSVVALEASSGLSATAHKVSGARTNLIAVAHTDTVATRGRSAKSSAQVTSEANSSGGRVLTTEAALYSRATATIEGKRVLSSTVNTNASFTQNVSALKQPTAKVSAQAKTSVTVLGNAVNNFKVTASAKSKVDVTGGVVMIGKSNVVSMSAFRARGIKQVTSDVSVVTQADLTAAGLKQPTASVTMLVSAVVTASSKRIRINKSYTATKSLAIVTGFKTVGFIVEVAGKATVLVLGARNLRSTVSLVSSATLAASLTDEKQLFDDEVFLVGHIKLFEYMSGVVSTEEFLDAYILDTSEIFLHGDFGVYESLDAIREYYYPLRGIAQ